ncbi:MAG: hypothetical protein ABUT39_02840 [Acidobacteriota bacterium]
MTHSIAHLRGLLGLPLLLALGTGAVRAQIDPIQDPIQADGMVLSEARLELGGDRVLSLDLPARGEVASLASLGSREWIAAGSFPNEDGRRLFLLTGSGDSRMLPEPAGQTGSERRSPVLLVENGTLAGLAWLEGDTGSTLSVRAAAWDGRGWGAVETVSRPGPGSQVGLTGAVLADGSWLLAWGAVDGEDDEIVWSLRRGEVWTPVRPVSENNHVPDVTPVLASSGDGALLAWSRYDGEGYRLRTARFDGRRWQDERPAGPTHTMRPAFVREDGHLYLLYQGGRPQSWSALELSPSGRALGRASALSVLSERPVLSEDAGGLRLRWPSSKWEAQIFWEKTP